MVHKCSPCDFTSDNSEEVEKHYMTISHTSTGISACRICNAQTDYTHTGTRSRKKIPCICDACKKKIAAEVASA